MSKNNTRYGRRGSRGPEAGLNSSISESTPSAVTSLGVHSSLALTSVNP